MLVVMIKTDETETKHDTTNLNQTPPHNRNGEKNNKRNERSKSHNQAIQRTHKH